MEDKKKEPLKVTEFQAEIIASQAKTISALEDNIKLLREQIELKEKVCKLEARDTIHVPPIKNGAVKTLELIETVKK